MPDGFCMCPRGPGALTLLLPRFLPFLSVFGPLGEGVRPGEQHGPEQEARVQPGKWPLSGVALGGLLEKAWVTGRCCGGWGDRLELGWGHSWP